MALLKWKKIRGKRENGPLNERRENKEIFFVSDKSKSKILCPHVEYWILKDLKLETGKTNFP